MSTSGLRVRPSLLAGLVLWPAASAVFLAFVAINSIPTVDLVTTVLGIGGFAVGLVPRLIGRWRRDRSGR